MMKVFLSLLLLNASFICVSRQEDGGDAGEQARTLMVHQLFGANRTTFADCRNNVSNGCKFNQKWKCQPLLKFCSPENVPVIDSVEGTCEVSSDCRPLFRCSKTNQCVFVGPKACESNEDCSSNVPQMQFVCKDLPDNIPGKRCWIKCHTDNHCTKISRPEHGKLVHCCQGLCQRKTKSCANAAK